MVTDAGPGKDLCRYGPDGDHLALRDGEPPEREIDQKAQPPPRVRRGEDGLHRADEVTKVFH